MALRKRNIATGVYTINDTNSMDLSLVATVLSADLKLSAAAADASNTLISLDIQADGLRAQSAALFTAQADITSLDGRLDAEEALSVTFDSRLDAEEALSVTFDSRLDAEEALSTSLDGRIDALEADKNVTTQNTNYTVLSTDGLI